MSRKFIELSGLAMSWRAFTTPDGERMQFDPACVDGWIRRPRASRVPIWVNHVESSELPVVGRVNLHRTDDGLEFSCNLERTHNSELFEVALATGHFRGCSVTHSAAKSQRRGDVRLITSCDIDEISVCDWPQNEWTTAKLSGELGVWCSHLPFMTSYLRSVDQRATRPRTIPAKARPAAVTAATSAASRPAKPAADPYRMTMQERREQVAAMESLWIYEFPAARNGARPLLFSH